MGDVDDLHNYRTVSCPFFGTRIGKDFVNYIPLEKTLLQLLTQEIVPDDLTKEKSIMAAYDESTSKWFALTGIRRLWCLREFSRLAKRKVVIDVHVCKGHETVNGWEVPKRSEWKQLHFEGGAPNVHEVEKKYRQWILERSVGSVGNPLGQLERGFRRQSTTSLSSEQAR